MNDTDEVMKVEVVLQRGGRLSVRVQSAEVAAEARYTLTLGVLQRALMDIYKHSNKDSA